MVLVRPPDDYDIILNSILLLKYNPYMDIE